jgi:hypothetical protein
MIKMVISEKRVRKLFWLKGLKEKLTRNSYLHEFQAMSPYVLCEISFRFQTMYSMLSDGEISHFSIPDYVELSIPGYGMAWIGTVWHNIKKKSAQIS